MTTDARYDQLALLYEGRTVSVFRGRDRRDGTTVILKTLKPGCPDLNKLQREYDILRELDLPGVIHVLRLEEDFGETRLVLEDRGGEALAARLRHGRLAFPTALRLAVELADALARVHGRRVIHKDINPSNVLIDGGGHACLIDFDISTRLPRETPGLRTPEMLAGTLSYISPEQTGRMNRSLDYRTDLYSFGVTFYEMLTGRLPFVADDAMGLIHCHIAKIADPPSAIDPSVPDIVSDIVMKLLAKAAEERYQSAQGLKADLDRCLQHLELTGGVEAFALGQKDVSDRFQIHQKLYGREREIERLEDAFRLAQRGTPELVLVAGSSGIGKSSVIHELYRSLPKTGAYFVSGKFDQFARDIPYSALRQALSELIRHVLVEPEEKLAVFRERIRAAVGDAGGALTDMLPELTSLIGPQPPVPELPAAEARSRFQVLFEGLLHAFTRHGHPLVIFVDDLQWLDVATLDLLPALFGDFDAGALLLIGAYRDNEITADHPLLSTIASLEKAGARPRKITIGPISIPDVTQLVQDTLGAAAADARRLAEFLWSRTDGNPLFITEFLIALHKNGLIELDSEGHRWTFDIAKIERAPITDNVSVLMAARTSALGERTRHLLALASMLGGTFDLETLAVVAQLSPAEVGAQIEEALLEGLVLVIDDASHAAYRFLHDRVHQAIYASIPEDTKLDLHYEIGQILLRSRFQESPNEWLFEVLRHLNHLEARVQNLEQRFQLASLNLTAAKKARSSGAFSSASRYYAAGVGFLPADAWTSHHDLMFEMHLGPTECEYMSSNHAAATPLFALLLDRARTDTERVMTYKLSATYRLHRAEYQEALVPALKALEILGIQIPPSPKAARFMLDLVRTRRALQGKSSSDLLNLPHIADPKLQLILRSLVVAAVIGYHTSQELFSVVSMHIVRFSVEHGNLSDSATGYATYGVLQIALFGAYEEGERFGKLALDICARYPDKSVETQVKMVNGLLIHSWRNPASESLRLLEEACQTGVLSGELLRAGFAASNIPLTMLFMGGQLDALYQKCDDMLAFARKLKHEIADRVPRAVQYIILALQGQTQLPGADEPLDVIEARYVEQLGTMKSQLLLHVYKICKITSLYILGRYEEGLSLSESIRGTVDKELSAQLLLSSYHFYDALLLLAVLPDRGPLARQRDLHLIRGHLRKLQKWAENAPMNFRHRYLLVSAELSRVTQDDHDALGRYEEAIAVARKYKFVHDEAIALERASKAYRSRGLVDVATRYLAQAREAYAAWGAHAMVSFIDRAYPGIATFTEEETHTTNKSERTTSTRLDALSIAKASQALSREFDINKLLVRMMSIVGENAGAERGSLALTQQGVPRIVAEFNARDGAYLPEHATSVQEHTNVCRSIVSYVLRTSESVILGDAAEGGAFMNDPYVVARRPKAILCTPLLEKGEVVGAVYLENNLVPAAFTPQRAELVGIICTQMAISIENAYLYATLEQKVIERTRELREAQAKLVRLEKDATERQMAGGFAHEIRNALAGAKLRLYGVYKRKGEETWSTCVENADVMYKLFLELRERLPEESLQRVTTMVRKITRGDEAVHKTLESIDRSLSRGLDITSMILDYSQVGKTVPGTSCARARWMMASAADTTMPIASARRVGQAMMPITTRPPIRRRDGHPEGSAAPTDSAAPEPHQSKRASTSPTRVTISRSQSFFLRRAASRSAAVASLSISRNAPCDRSCSAPSASSGKSTRSEPAWARR